MPQYRLLFLPPFKKFIVTIEIGDDYKILFKFIHFAINDDRKLIQRLKDISYDEKCIVLVWFLIEYSSITI